MTEFVFCQILLLAPVARCCFYCYPMFGSFCLQWSPRARVEWGAPLSYEFWRLSYLHLTVVHNRMVHARIMQEESIDEYCILTYITQLQKP